MTEIQRLHADLADEASAAAELRIELELEARRASFVARLPQENASDLITLTSLLGVTVGPGLTLWAGNVAGTIWPLVLVAIAQVCAAVAVVKNRRTPRHGPG